MPALEGYYLKISRPWKILPASRSSWRHCLKRFSYIIISTILLISYIVSVIHLDDVKILAGNVTPIVNQLALLGLVAVGLIAAAFVMGMGPSVFSFLMENGAVIKKHRIYLLLAVLALFRIAAFFLSPEFIQYMRVWPDSTNYLADMHIVLKDPIRIFDRKSPVYTIWLIINHITFGKVLGFMGFQDSGDYFGVKVFFNDIIPPIFLQNILGILSALICFRIFSKINARLAYAVTFLTFLNPTTLAIENALLRESLALFFILSGFALFIKTVLQKKSIYGFASGVLFVLAYQTRPELLTIYLFLCLGIAVYSLLQKEKIWRSVVLLYLPLLLSVIFFGNTMSYKYYAKIYSGRFGVAISGLKSECYFYKSTLFPDLIKNIQDKALQCEKERMAPCETPAPSLHVFRQSMDAEIDKYIQVRELQNSKAEIIDQIFIDIVKNNTLYLVKSVLINMWYNLIHNVHNMSPILYDGNNYWVSENWNYYESPKMLELYEEQKSFYKYMVYLFRAIELYTVRKVLFPFFFIGSAIILKLTHRNLFANPTSNVLLSLCVLLISWIHLLFISTMANPVARFIYPISQFIFVVEIIGVMCVYYWLKSYFLSCRSH